MKGSVSVALDPKHVSFYDPLTNSNFWTDTPPQTFSLEQTNLAGIKRAVEIGVLKLVDGSFSVEKTEESKKTRSKE